MNLVFSEYEISFSIIFKTCPLLMISNYLHLQPLPGPLNTGTKIVSRPVNVVIFSDFIVLILVDVKSENKNGIAYVGQDWSVLPRGNSEIIILRIKFEGDI